MLRDSISRGLVAICAGLLIGGCDQTTAPDLGQDPAATGLVLAAHSSSVIGFLLAFIVGYLSACAPGYTTEQDWDRFVPVKISVNAAHTEILHLVFQCPYEGQRVNAGQVRNGQTVWAPVCRDVIVAMTSTRGVLWRDQLRLERGWTYRMRIEEPILHSSILHTNIVLRD